MGSAGSSLSGGADPVASLVVSLLGSGCEGVRWGCFWARLWVSLLDGVDWRLNSNWVSSLSKTICWVAGLYTRTQASVGFWRPVYLYSLLLSPFLILRRYACEDGVLDIVVVIFGSESLGL